MKRDTSVLCYDCTNFYFECEQPDEDVIDEVTGEIINGLRKFGISIKHRLNPIVEMGLFMDSRDIPIAMRLHPGNTSKQVTVTAVPLEKEVLQIKLRDTLKKSVFNDFDCKLLSNDAPVNISSMKEFDRHLEENLKLYNDFAY